MLRFDHMDKMLGCMYSPVCSSTNGLNANFLHWQIKIDAGVGTPERMTPGYLNHLDLGEAVATLVERRNTSHTVYTVNCPADLKTLLLEGSL